MHTYRDKTNHRYTFIDLFAGIGGIRLAFEKAGARCVFSSEWDRWCAKTYEDNFGDVPIGDITKVEAKEIPVHDILTGGFPCQPFSIAGVSKKRSLNRATGFEDKTQGTLFFDVCRILEARRPKAFLLENVKNLVSHDKGNTFRVIRESIDSLDYELSWKILDGSMFVPQHRERIFLIGFDRKRYGSAKFDFDIKTPRRKPVLLDILEDEPDPKYTLSDKLWSYLQEYAARQKAKGNGFGYGLADPNGVTRTLSARYYKDGSEILIPVEGNNPRKLTPRECARLQGFPDSFKIVCSDGKAMKQFGNSVVVPLVKAIADKLIQRLEELDG